MTPANASIKMGGVGLLTALLASSCCIIPFIAFIAGSSGMASAFSWIAPIRPYLIALSIGVLSFAWYQKLRKNKAAVDCCGNVQQPPFIQSRTFLGMITVFTVAMMAFPLYSNSILGTIKKTNPIMSKSNMSMVEFTISGMTCTGCENHIEQAVGKVQGVALVNASYENSNAIVNYDTMMTSLTAIREAIASTGYKIINNDKN